MRVSEIMTEIIKMVTHVWVLSYMYVSLKKLGRRRKNNGIKIFKTKYEVIVR